MALCCIGGVCIPYSALVPLLVYALKWLVEKLVTAGLLPKSLETELATRLGRPPSTRKEPPSLQETTDSCCSIVKVIDDEDQWAALVSSSDTPVVVKFTAVWCHPCKAIQPVFEQLADEHRALFVTVDVDELDSVTAEYGIAMMPTFGVIKNGKMVARYSGSDQEKLRAFCRANLA